jgi:hypothetical protein
VGEAVGHVLVSGHQGQADPLAVPVDLRVNLGLATIPTIKGNMT